MTTAIVHSFNNPPRSLKKNHQPNRKNPMRRTFYAFLASLAIFSAAGMLSSTAADEQTTLNIVPHHIKKKKK